MIVYEAKLRGTEAQYRTLDEVIRTGQFVRNKALRYWMDRRGVKRSDLLKLCTSLRNEFFWCRRLSAQACQSSADRAWAAISRFQRNCRLQIPGKKDYPKFKKNCRSVEYKTDGWKLSDDRRRITFKDGFRAGEFQLIGTRDLHFYQKEQIKRVRIVRRTTGYYCQFVVDCDRVEMHCWTGKTVGIARGIKCFFSDSEGNSVENLQSLPKTYKAFKRAQRRLSRKIKYSKNRSKAKARLGKAHLQLSRRRKDWACKTARALVKSADLIVYEDLNVNFPKNNRQWAKALARETWSEFIRWLEYFAKIHGILIIAVPPLLGKQKGNKNEAKLVKDADSHIQEDSEPDAELPHDQSTAKAVLAKGLFLLGGKREGISKLVNTVGRTEINAWGDRISDIPREI